MPSSAYVFPTGVATELKQHFKHSGTLLALQARYCLAAPTRHFTLIYVLSTMLMPLLPDILHRSMFISRVSYHAVASSCCQQC